MESEEKTELVQKRDREAWEQYLRTRSVEDRNRLVELNYFLLRARAAKYFKQIGCPGWTSIEDLESLAVRRLIRAVELFDPSQQVQFGTYATWAIDRELWRAINHQMEVPVYLNAEMRNKVARRIPLSRLQDKGWNPSTHDRERAVMEDNWVAKLRKFLPERDHQILMLRYHEGLTLDEAGERMGVTRERIRQIESRAIRRLQQETESALLMENAKPLVGLRVSELIDDQRPQTKGSIVDNIDPLKVLEAITLSDVERKISELEATLDGWKAIYKIVAARSGVVTKKSRIPRAARATEPTSDDTSGSIGERVVSVLRECGPLHPSEIAERVGATKQGMHFRLKAISGIRRREDGAYEAV